MAKRWGKADLTRLVQTELDTMLGGVVRLGVTRKTVDLVFEGVAEILANGDSITIEDFGKFEIKTRKARRGHNPKTGEPVHIPEKQVPVFTSSPSLRRVVREDG